jgi:hypothetical protein
MLIYENKKGAEQTVEKLNRTQEAVNKAVSEFNKLPLKKITTKEQVLALFTTELDNFVLDMLPMAENQTLFGITVNKQKAVSLLELDTQPFKTRFQSHEFSQIAVDEFLSIATQKNGQFSIDSKLLAKRLETFKRYAQTPKEVEVAKAMEAIIQNFNTLVKHGLNLRRIETYFKATDSSIELNIHKVGELLK